ncbi:MAG: GNAT family N-acetyltransferase [Chlorobia bacterium]|nr:GNAT family N-acetyltransferase [Fimbriimonadaceae bacterium]
MTAMKSDLLVRKARPEDNDRLATICFEAFGGINATHNFPPDFSNLEIVQGFMGFIISAPFVESFVAEQDGKVVGSSFLWPGAEISGVGPVTVDPLKQGSVGRTLMEATIAKSDELGQKGVRLVQAAFNRTSMALYAKLGFDVKEPLVCLNGPSIGKSIPGYSVRKPTPEDIPGAEAVCRRVHGHDRTGEFAMSIENGTGRVVESEGKIVGYTTDTAFFGHSVADSNEAMSALLGAAEAFSGPGILVPSRNGELFRWCLAHGLKIVQPMTLMAKGWYQEPRGAFLPSILF